MGKPNKTFWGEMHSIIHIRDIVMLDWQYYVENSSQWVWMWGIFYRILMLLHCIRSSMFWGRLLAGMWVWCLPSCVATRRRIGPTLSPVIGPQSPITRQNRFLEPYCSCNYQFHILERRMIKYGLESLSKRTTKKLTRQQHGSKKWSNTNSLWPSTCFHWPLVSTPQVYMIRILWWIKGTHQGIKDGTW